MPEILVSIYSCPCTLYFSVDEGMNVNCCPRCKRENVAKVGYGRIEPIRITTVDKRSEVKMPKLELGQVVATRGLMNYLTEENIPASELNELFVRHANGDWGDTPEEDKKMNEEALIHGSRIMSSYTIGKEKVWIITEWDRSITTALFPDEY